MLKVELVVDRQVVLEDIERVLRLLIALAALGGLDHHVGNTVTDGGSSGLISLSHPFSKLHVSLLGLILLARGRLSRGRLDSPLSGALTTGVRWRGSFLPEALSNHQE